MIVTRSIHGYVYRWGVAYDRRRLPVVRDIETTLWLEWFTNEDGYWDDDAIEYRRV